jgi:Thymidylate synthase
VSERDIKAESVSHGWLRVCRLMLGAREHQATHVVVRMAHPLPEDAGIRADADAFMAVAGHDPIDEVRNTIFPAAMADDFADPVELAAEYMEDYDLRRRLAGGQGTYFGRICEYPHPSGPPTRQLENVVVKLRKAATDRRWRSTYQLNIYAEHADKEKTRPFFPCMAHLAFQLASDRGQRKPERLDCLALYRNQNMTLKAYGNYLGLAELQGYVAAATGFRPGELTVVAGHAELELNRGDGDRLRDLTAKHLDIGDT